MEENQEITVSEVGSRELFLKKNSRWKLQWRHLLKKYATV